MRARGSRRALSRGRVELRAVLRRWGCEVRGRGVHLHCVDGGGVAESGARSLWGGGFVGGFVVGVREDGDGVGGAVGCARGAGAGWVVEEGGGGGVVG